jgi:uridine kinase
MIDPLIIEKIKRFTKPAIIAISGFGGSGKSTIAMEIGELLSAPVVGVDSFWKDTALNDYSMWDIVDFERLEREIFIPFQKGEKHLKYGQFDWGSNSVIGEKEINVKNHLVVEGVGLFRPELKKYFDLTIWVDCSLDEAISRGKKRDREVYKNPQDENWDGVWKKNDVEYFEKFKPKESANVLNNI